MTNRQALRHARLAAVVMGVVAVGVAGYGGFLAITHNRALGVGAAALGALTGFAAFFSPCSFPLMLTFLARRTGDSPRAAMTSAARMALGAVSLLALTAGVMAAGATAVGIAAAFGTPGGRVLRGVTGAVLVTLGLRQAGKVRLFGFDRVGGRAASALDPSRARTRTGSDFLYGFGYLLAGFG